MTATSYYQPTIEPPPPTRRTPEERHARRVARTRAMVAQATCRLGGRLDLYRGSTILHEQAALVDAIDGWTAWLAEHDTADCPACAQMLGVAS